MPSRRNDRDFPGWAWVMAAAALAALLWRGSSARPSAAPIAPVFPAAAPAGPTAAGYGAPPPATGYGPNAAVNATGSGMPGTALAATAGAAAGMLLEKVLDERGAPIGTGVPAASAVGGSGAVAPGLASGAAESNPAAAELEQRPIDFGQDNESVDNWADDGGSGGTSDVGGGDGSTDGDW